MGREMRNDEEAMARRAASRELGKAKRSIAAIKNFYLANVILCAVVLLLFWQGACPSIHLNSAGCDIAGSSPGLVHVNFIEYAILGPARPATSRSASVRR